MSDTTGDEMTETYTEPLPLTGWPRLVRWIRCHLANHSGTHTEWETEQITPGLRRRKWTSWCADCGRPLHANERATCRACGQRISHPQLPEEG